MGLVKIDDKNKNRGKMCYDCHFNFIYIQKLANM